LDIFESNINNEFDTQVQNKEAEIEKLKSA
jgi:hypothetical protein